MGVSGCREDSIEPGDTRTEMTKSLVKKPHSKYTAMAAIRKR